MTKKIVENKQKNEGQKISYQESNKSQANLYDKLFSLIYDGEKYLHYWNKTTGLWQKDGEQFLRMKMGKLFTSHAKREIINLLKDDNYKEDIRFNSRKDILPLKDGVIELPSMKFRKHKSEDMLSYSLPLYYDKKAKSKHIVPFLEKTITNPSELWNLYAMIGYCFVRSTPFKAVFWLIGKTNTGKSSFLEILRKFFGDLVSSVSVYDFDKPEYLEGLRGRMVNIEDELSGNTLSKGVVNSLKWLSGTEVEKQGKELYRNPRGIVIKPKIIMAGNHYPLPKEQDQAYYDRCVFVNFGHQFKLTNKDDVIDKMTSQNELSALLNIVLKHLKQLNRRSKFKPSEDPRLLEIEKDEIKDNADMLEKYKKRRMSEIAREM